MLNKGIGSHEVLPEQIALFVENVCNQQKKYNTPAPPPHMLIPLNGGCGRSRLTRIVANHYYHAKACVFSSRDIFLDFTLRETVYRIYEVEAEIKSNSEYANNFHGVVALNIDALLPHLNEAAGNKFFELVENVKHYSTVLIFVPSDCSKKHLDMITEKVGLSIQSFPPITYTDEDYARFFYTFLPTSIFPKPNLPLLTCKTNDNCFEKYRDRIIDYIARKVRNKTIKNVKEAAEAVFFSDEAKELLVEKVTQNKESEVLER